VEAHTAKVKASPKVKSSPKVKARAKMVAKMVTEVVQQGAKVEKKEANRERKLVSEVNMLVEAQEVEEVEEAKEAKEIKEAKEAKEAKQSEKNKEVLAQDLANIPKAQWENNYQRILMHNCDTKDTLMHSTLLCLL